jgi:hypothetical protein
MSIGVCFIVSTSAEAVGSPAAVGRIQVTFAGILMKVKLIDLLRGKAAKNK